MAIREIRKKGDPCLEKVCHPVTEFNERLHLLLDDMRETLEESGGVGLADVYKRQCLCCPARCCSAAPLGRPRAVLQPYRSAAESGRRA